MKKYYVALSFYVEESADNLKEAKKTALYKLRYKGEIHDLEATGIKRLDDWREITIAEGRT